MPLAHSDGAWHTLRGRREENHDGGLVRELAGDRLLVAVADGMGGHRGGGVASKRALEELAASMEAGCSLPDAVRAANAAVFSAASETPDLSGMGTTLVAVLTDPDQYVVANVGDSRAYRIDSGRIRQLTADHSFAAEALAKGTLSEDELEDSPWRNALMRAIGTEAEVQVDLFGPFSTRPPHYLLLCTDGLHGVVSDDRILKAAEDTSDLEAIPREVCELAYEAGATDNITAAVVSVGRVARESDDSRDSSVSGAAHQRPVAGVGERSGNGTGQRSRRGAREGSGSSRGSERRVVVRSRWGSRLSRKTKVELGVIGVTLVLAILAAFMILRFL